MEKKLKIRIGSIDEAAKRLTAEGAKFIGELDNEFIYFCQPPNKVLKLVVNKGGYSLMKSEKQGERFEVLVNKKVENLTEAEDRLTKEYGISKKIYNFQKIYKYHDFVVTLNQVKNIGNFLTLVGQAPTIELMRQLSGLENPEIVAESYDNVATT